MHVHSSSPARDDASLAPASYAYAGHKPRQEKLPKKVGPCIDRIDKTKFQLNMIFESQNTPNKYKQKLTGMNTNRTFVQTIIARRYSAGTDIARNVKIQISKMIKTIFGVEFISFLNNISEKRSVLCHVIIQTLLLSVLFSLFTFPLLKILRIRLLKINERSVKRKPDSTGHIRSQE